MRTASMMWPVSYGLKSSVSSGKSTTGDYSPRSCPVRALERAARRTAHGTRARLPTRTARITMAALDSELTLVDLTWKDDWQKNPNLISYNGTPPAGFAQDDLKDLNMLARILLSNPSVVFPPPPVPQPNERSVRINAAKEQGNKHFRAQQWADAVKVYSIAAEIAASRPVFEANVYARDELAMILSNRSAAYVGAGEHVNALVDAEAVIQIKRPWVKGHFRKGKALAAMGRLEEAREALLLGLQFDPTSEVCSLVDKHIRRV